MYAPPDKDAPGATLEITAPLISNGSMDIWLFEDRNCDPGKPSGRLTQRTATEIGESHRIPAGREVWLRVFQTQRDRPQPVRQPYAQYCMNFYAVSARPQQRLQLRIQAIGAGNCRISLLDAATGASTPAVRQVPAAQMNDACLLGLQDRVRSP